jgi:Bacterial aa3 type cytochrome c oxidase subunit IV
MADQHAASELNPAMDYAQHEATYRMFIQLTKWSTVFLVLLLIFMSVTLL